MLWWLVILLFVAPDSGLHKSALQAFGSSVGLLSRAGVEQSATSRRERTKRGEDEPGIAGRAEGSFRGSVSASAPQLRSLRAALLMKVRTGGRPRRSESRMRLVPARADI